MEAVESSLSVIFGRIHSARASQLDVMSDKNNMDNV